jgi:hypothetical protein
MTIETSGTLKFAVQGTKCTWHEPKHGYFDSLAEAMTAIATILAAAETAYNANVQKLENPVRHWLDLEFHLLTADRSGAHLQVEIHRNLRVPASDVQSACAIIKAVWATVNGALPCGGFGAVPEKPYRMMVRSMAMTDSFEGLVAASVCVDGS